MFPHSNRHLTQGSLTAGLRLAAMGMAVLWLAGCGGNGESVLMNLHAAAPTEAAAKPANGPTVAVTQFDDSALTNAKRLGSRAHLWGGTSHFDLAEGKPGDVVATLVAEGLKQRGWHVEKAGADGKAQATISGKIQELSVNAKSSFGSTDITTATKIVVEAANADGSKVRMTLSGAGAQSVFWFEPEDAQALLAETVSDSLGKFIANTKVEENALRLK